MIAFTLKIRTKNPNNGSAGWSRNAAFAKARRRKAERMMACLATRASVGKTPEFPCIVTLTRRAPSQGLDPHDGLGASMKGVIDGIADGLGLRDDRDSRVTWVLAQCRSRHGVWEVGVVIERNVLAD